MRRNVPKDRAIFRDGKVHVIKEHCKTCVFLPGNRMFLSPGQLKRMVDESNAEEAAIPCHKTLDREEAICRGFFDLQSTQPIQVATRLGFVKFVGAPTDEHCLDDISPINPHNSDVK